MSLLMLVSISIDMKCDTPQHGTKLDCSRKPIFASVQHNDLELLHYGQTYKTSKDHVPAISSISRENPFNS
jgi:hypothetical protein